MVRSSGSDADLRRAVCAGAAQTVPAPVPANEVFTREQIGHALSAPTPEAGRTAAERRQCADDDGQWTMPSKNYASTRFSR